MPVTVRATTPADLDVFVTTLHAAFARFPEQPDEDGSGVFWSVLEMDRNLLAVTEDGRPVGTTAGYSFELTLPGGARIPTTGVTNVGVVPSHRRRGIATALMRRQLTDVRARGEHVAVLLAMEATIYRRFGYGPATFSRRMSVSRARAAFDDRPLGASSQEDGGGSVEVLRREECVSSLEEVYEQYRLDRPGALDRPHRWWVRGAGHPPVSREPRWIGLHRNGEGRPDGYVSYRLDDGVLHIDETITTDDAVREALDRFVIGHDLVREVVFQDAPTDHPLRWQLLDYDAVASSGDEAWLWVRILDVAGALEARSWAGSGELVLQVEDAFLSESSRYLLTVDGGRAECTATPREPDLTLDVSDLASLYLGGVPPRDLVRAGRVRARGEAAVEQAEALFATERAPWSHHIF
ncbi:GNAT family N-acetyltransferase [Kineococcus sp. R8]|uniref:GNAT family N-acetyltransferase n=1 Tax=Kineococcus siccus TaxID=2696567 RepID=UPI001411FA19|nr:GNAT family N-acetyltransferase [Kineococcus siccus]